MTQDTFNTSGSSGTNSINIDSNGTTDIPENIVASVASLKAIYNKLRSDHVGRISDYAQIKGMFAGNPPYDHRELEKAGIPHITNINNQESGAILNKVCLGFWNLVNEAENLIKITLTYPEDAGHDTLELSKAATIMAQEWTKIIKKYWKGFVYAMGTLSSQLVKMGISPVIFHSEESWQWKVVEYPKFYVQDQALSDLSNLEYVAVETPFTLSYLVNCYKEFKGKPESSSPWNVKALEKLLVDATKSTLGVNNENFSVDTMFYLINSGTSDWGSASFGNVRMISMYVREYDGKISHYMFPKDYSCDDYIYMVSKQYNSMDEFLVLFTLSPGEFTIHENQGLGSKIFSLMQAVMQLDCSLVDMGKWGSTPMLKNSSGNTTALKLTPGVPIDIGNADFQAVNIGGSADGLIAISQYITGKIQNNNIVSGDDPSIPDTSEGSVSLAQFKAKTYKEFSVMKNIVALFYLHLDTIFENMVAKMMKQASSGPTHKNVDGHALSIMWKRKCIARGVPEEVFDYKPLDGFLLPEHIEVAATRVAGDGSTLAKIMGMQDITPFLGDFGAKERKHYLWNYISSVLSPDVADAYVPRDVVSDEDEGGASLAGVENSVMQMGKSPIFSSQNNHRAHCVTHGALASELIKAQTSGAEQAMTPIDLDKIFTVLVPHLTEHLQAVAQSVFNKSFAATFKKTFSQINNYAILNRKNATKMLQSQMKQQKEAVAAQETVMSDAQRKDFIAKKDVERADFKVVKQVERADQANVTRGDVMRQKIERDTEVKKLKVERDTEVARMKADLENTQKQLEAMVGNTPSPSDIETVRS